MTEKLQQIAREETGKLSRETQEAINSLDWGSICEEISKKYGLMEEEINDLQTETLLALTGIQDVNFFATYIENNIGLTTEEAKNISEEIAQKIFLPVERALEEKLKAEIQNSGAELHQNVDFILSGGDYAAFLNTPKEEDGV